MTVVPRLLVVVSAVLALGATACTAGGGEVTPAPEPSSPSASVSVSATADPAGQRVDVPGLSPAALEIMNSAPYERSTWAVRVTDAETGEVLVSYQDGIFLEPASVTKTFSTGAAWLKWGPDSVIVTPVVRTGEVQDGVLDGDLVLVAQGDITMGGQTGPDGSVVFTDMDHNDANLIPGATIADNDPLAGLDDLARQVRASGIREVAGDVAIDDRLFITRDLGENDGPVSPIVINNNLIDLVTLPTEPGEVADVTVRPVVAPWTVTSRVRTVEAGGETDIQVSGGKGGRIVLTGTIAADSDPVLKVWHLADPATFARTAFIEALGRAGVLVRADATAPNRSVRLPSEDDVAAAPQVAALTGLPLEEHVTYILKVSYNRGAQTQICLLAVSVGSRDCDAGLAELGRIMAEAGVDPRAVSLVDGSGLPGNYVAATAITDLMQAFAARPDAEQWQQAMPIMGVDGSVARVQVDSPAAGQVFAKTGTLGAADFVNNRFRVETKALGGYIEASSGRLLTLALIVNQAMFDDLAGVFAANEDLGKIATTIYEDY